MLSRAFLERLLVVYCAFCIFLSYAGYFIPVGVAYYLGSGVMLMLFYFVALRGRPQVNSDNLWFFGCFFLVLLLGLLETNAYSYGIFKIQVLFFWVVFFFGYSGLVKAYFDLFSLASVVVGGIYLSMLIVTFGDPLSYIQSVQIETARLGVYDSDGFALNPIWVGRYLGFIFLASIFVLLRFGKYKSLLYLFLLSVLLFMIATGSKGPLASLLLASLVLLLGNNAKRNVRIVGSIAFALFILAGILYFLNFFDSAFFTSRFLNRGESITSREGLIARALSLLEANPFIGTGTGNFGYIETGGDNTAYPHNILVELLVENGILGALFVIIMLTYVLKKRLYIYTDLRLKLVFSYFVYFFINSLFSGDISGNQYLFIFFILFVTIVEDFSAKKFASNTQI